MCEDNKWDERKKKEKIILDTTCTFYKLERAKGNTCIYIFIFIVWSTANIA